MDNEENKLWRLAVYYVDEWESASPEERMFYDEWAQDLFENRA